MNIFWAAVIVVAVTAIAVAAMMAVQRRAPEGGYYADSDRASGVFGVLATGFSVLLGFLIFLGFESYDASRSGAEAEALTVAQQVQTAQRLSAEVGGELTGELVCYARWVIDDEWERMEAGSLGEDINPWGAAMFGTLQGYEPGSAAEEANYAKWLDQTEARELARQDRIHGAAGIMPVPLWIVLFFIAAIIFVFLLGMADAASGPGFRHCSWAASSRSSPPCCCCSTSSTIRSTAASADSSRTRWSERCCSSISNSRSSAVT